MQQQRSVFFMVVDVELIVDGYVIIHLPRVGACVYTKLVMVANGLAFDLV